MQSKIKIYKSFETIWYEIDNHKVIEWETSESPIKIVWFLMLSFCAELSFIYFTTAGKRRFTCCNKLELWVQLKKNCFCHSVWIEIKVCL